MLRRSYLLDAIPEPITEAFTAGAPFSADSEYKLVPRNGVSFPTGWAVVSLRASALEGEPIVTLQADTVGTSAQQCSWSIVPVAQDPSGSLVRLPPGVEALRLLALYGVGRFRVDSVEIKPLGRLGLIWRLVMPRVRHIAREPRMLFRLIGNAARLLHSGGVKAVVSALIGKSLAARRDYDEWVSLFDTLAPADEAAIRSEVSGLRYRPLFSLVLPVFNTPEPLLIRCVESVREQLYPNWQLCIADDASSMEHVAHICADYAQRDSRIKFVARRTNGRIAAASNSALELGTGEFVGLIDHDDELAPHALYMVALALNKDADLDLVFSDEDKIDESGRRFDPWFKCDWNYDLMLSQNVVVHFAVFRRSIVESIGGFRPGFEGSQDYDFTLRFIERTTPERIKHIPFVLYHWRATSGSVALSPGEKSYAYEAAQRAIQEHLERCGRQGRVSRETHQGYYRVHWPLPQPAPKVSIIIPTKDKVELLRKAVDSILERTDYPNYELLIVNNRSRERETEIYLKELRQRKGVRVVDYDYPYSYAALNNWAVGETDGLLIGFLNNDTEVITPGWLREMASNAVRPEVGAVGAKLYYPNNTVQHAGIVVGFGGLAGHPHLGFPRGAAGYFGRAVTAQRFSAVTAACMVLRREVFDEVEGFDAERFAVAFNDVDLCLRIGQAGYGIVWSPYAELYHYESASLGPPESGERRSQFEREVANLRGRWGDVIANDPYYNPNLTLTGGDFGLAFPPRVLKPWLAQGDLTRRG